MLGREVYICRKSVCRCTADVTSNLGENGGQAAYSQSNTHASIATAATVQGGEILYRGRARIRGAVTFSHPRIRGVKSFPRTGGVFLRYLARHGRWILLPRYGQLAQTNDRWGRFAVASSLWSCLPMPLSFGVRAASPFSLFFSRSPPFSKLRARSQQPTG